MAALSYQKSSNSSTGDGVTTRKIGIAVLATMAALLPFVPDQVSVLTVLFSFSFAFALLASLPHVLDKMPRSQMTQTLLLCGFFLSLLSSFAVATSNDVTAAAWLRGVIPFVFLMVYWFVPKKDASDAQYAINILHLSSLAWALSIGVNIFPHLGAIMSGEILRLTLLTNDLSLPYGMIGLILSLHNPAHWAVKYRGVLTAVFLVVLIGSGFRLQYGLMVLIFLHYFWMRGVRIFLPIAIFVLTAVAAVVTIGLEPLLDAAGTPPLIVNVLARFQDLGSELESTRMLEIHYALEQFVESPLYGKGLGYPIPVAVTFAGDAELIRRLVDYDTVGYIHNGWAYFLMDLGLFGFVFFFLFTTYPVLQVNWGRLRSDPIRAREPLLIVWLYMLCLITFEPTVRHIQTNIILALVAAAMLSLRPSTHSVRRRC